MLIRFSRYLSIFWYNISMSEEQDQKTKEKKFIDIHETTSDKKGLWWAIEVFLRRHKTGAYLFFYIWVVFVCMLCVALSLAPIYALVLYAYEATKDAIFIFHVIALSYATAMGLVFGTFALLSSTAFFNLLNPFPIKPRKNNWYSIENIPWFYHNALVYLVRYSILDYITPSPIQQWWLKAMGMKIGKGVVINTSNISDPCLITLEDYSTIGGSVTMMAHYGQKGILVIEEVIVKKGAMVGLKASIFGDVVIGEYASVLPHTAVLPKSRIEKNEA